MPTPLTLIQLISEQTMQNLVPLLALRPARVVHLATPKTAARSAQIVEAARQAQVSTELESVRLSEMPSIPETSRTVLRAVQAAREAQETPVVNFTGGTKLMSIGAYEAAMREQVTGSSRRAGPGCECETSSFELAIGFQISDFKSTSHDPRSNNPNSKPNTP